jgi:hypothetical protein
MPANSSFDPTTWFDMYRSACGPMLRIQEESFQAMDRFIELQHEFMTDWLETNRAHAHALLEAQSPADFLRAEGELAAKFGEKMRSRAEEFFEATTEAQNALSRTSAEAVAKGTEAARKGAAEAQSSLGRAAGDLAKEAARSEPARSGETSRRPS